MNQPRDYTVDPNPAPTPGELVPHTVGGEPTAAPSRKWNYGALGGIIVAAVIAGLTAYDVELATKWVPVIAALAGAAGFAVPNYIVKNRE